MQSCAYVHACVHAKVHVGGMHAPLCMGVVANSVIFPFILFEYLHYRYRTMLSWHWL